MGNNSEGKLGVGHQTLRHSTVPCLVDGLVGIKMVACGASHTLALGVNGQVFSFGQGLYGALGLSETGGGMRDRPKLIQALQNTPIVEISAGARHSLFLSETRKIFACGEAKQG